MSSLCCPYVSSCALLSFRKKQIVDQLSKRGWTYMLLRSPGPTLFHDETSDIWGIEGNSSWHALIFQAWFKLCIYDASIPRFCCSSHTTRSSHSLMCISTARNNGVWVGGQTPCPMELIVIRRHIFILALLKTRSYTSFVKWLDV